MSVNITGNLINFIPKQIYIAKLPFCFLRHFKSSRLLDEETVSVMCSPMWVREKSVRNLNCLLLKLNLSQKV